MYRTYKRSNKSIPTVKPKIDKEFEQSLQRLYQNLQLFLNEAQHSAALAEQRLKQAQEILKPWPAPPKEQVECLCKGLQTLEVSQNNDDIALLDNITKTLENAKALRSTDTKNSSKLVNETSAKFSSVSCKSLVNLKSSSFNRKSASIGCKSTFIGGDSTLAGGKSIAARTKSSSTSTKSSLQNSKASTSVITSAIVKKSSMQADPRSASSTLSKIAKDSTNTTTSKVSTGTIPKTTNSSTKRISLQPSSQSSFRNASKVSSVFKNTHPKLNLIAVCSTAINRPNSTSVETNISKANTTSPSRQISAPSISETSGSILKDHCNSTSANRSSLRDSSKLLQFSVPCTSKGTDRIDTTLCSSTKEATLQSRSLRILESKKSHTALAKETASTTHYPSCPCYNTEEKPSEPTSLSLSEALSVYHIPSSLRTAVKRYHKFIQDTEKEETESKKIDSKAKFLQLLQKRNEQSIERHAKKTPWLNKFIKYISLYANHQRNLKKNVNKIRYVPYTNGKDLETYLMNKCKTRNKQMWNMILKCIIDDVLPTIKVDGRDKLHMIQMLKTICKFANNSVPSVPIFRIN